MNKKEAVEKLSSMMSRPVNDEYVNKCTFTDNCPNDECMICGIAECPGEEPLHYHHDGCPYCDTNDIEEDE